MCFRGLYSYSYYYHRKEIWLTVDEGVSSVEMTGIISSFVRVDGIESISFQIQPSIGALIQYTHCHALLCCRIRHL
eukprot:Gb_35485 [translate_table: standard]